MIPKIIHYCWFGGKPKPKSVKKCIKSWKKYCPDFEIKEWNESNFDINSFVYTKEAYQAHKMAFVADVARLKALCGDGGVYMDTDVELVKPLDPFMDLHGFACFESPGKINTGLLACEKGSKWASDNLEQYRNRHFVKADGTLDVTTNVLIISAYMEKLGLNQSNEYQDFPGFFTIFPRTFFCPLDWNGGPSDFTPSTVAIHHFDGSWLSLDELFWNKSKGIHERHPFWGRFWFRLWGYPIYKFRKNVLKEK